MVLAELPDSLRASSSLVSSMVSSAERCLRASPMTTAWLTTEMLLSLPSITCGAMFSPPAVMMRSFLRSVIFKKPFSIFPMSPECSQPSSSSASEVAASFL